MQCLERATGKCRAGSAKTLGKKGCFPVCHRSVRSVPYKTEMA